MTRMPTLIPYILEASAVGRGLHWRYHIPSGSDFKGWSASCYKPYPSYSNELPYLLDLTLFNESVPPNPDGTLPNRALVFRTQMSNQDGWHAILYHMYFQATRYEKGTLYP